MTCFPLFNVFYESVIYASKWDKKVQMYAETVAPRAMTPTVILCVCGGGGHHPPPALSNVGKYVDCRCYKLFHCTVGPLLLYCTTRIPNSINQ